MERFEERKRSRVYKGRCSTCGSRVPILVSTSYDPLLGLASHPSTKTLMECLRCGGVDVDLYAKERRTMHKDIQAWRQRVDFTEKVKPIVEEKIMFESELGGFIKGLGEGGKDK